MKPIAKVETEWKTVADAFEDTLAHEKKVTAMIHNINKLAIAENDYATQNRMTWFIDEQIEEEEEAEKLLGTAKMIGDNNVGMYMFDKELAARTYVQPSVLK